MASIKRIHKSLDYLNKNTSTRYLDIEQDSWIIFSDHHRGVGDGADDFAPCKETYLSALNHYSKQGFGLILLGDVEEFWENTLKSVVTKYADVLQAEKEFYEQSKLLKV
ncbi:hypothetical protein N9J07_04075 [Bacteroidia bacterium]|nr:hypothetical protein [Bacteroidia bacterium]